MVKSSSPVEVCFNKGFENFTYSLIISYVNYESVNNKQVLTGLLTIQLLENLPWIPINDKNLPIIYTYLSIYTCYQNVIFINHYTKNKHNL